METPGREAAERGPSQSSTMSTMMFDAGAGQSRSVKRPRPVKSCTECRKRKLKCNRLAPCTQCEKAQRVCRYAPADADGGASDGSDAETTTERPHKRIVTRPLPASAPPPEGHPPPTFSLNGSDVQQITSALIDEFSSRLDRLERLVVTKDHTNNALEDRHSLPPPPHTITASPSTMRGLSVKGSPSLRTRFFGQDSTRVLLNLFDEAKDFMFNKAKRETAKNVFAGLHNIYMTLQQEQRKALAPIKVFVDNMVPVQQRMADILPKRPVCDRLLEAYIGTSEGLYRIIHTPSFRKEYNAYWEGLPSRTEGFLPRMLCIMCIGSRFETDSRGLCHDRSDGVHIPTACALVRTWLDTLRGKQLIDVATLQAEVLLLHAQRMIAPRYQNTWTQLGLITRMAMTMGLHRDPSEFPQISPFVGEMRRKLWFTIMDMDLHVALACSLPGAVKDGEYTCKPPRNLDDAELYPEMQELPPSKPIDYSTDAQMQCYAASTLPFRMRAIDVLCRLDNVRDYSEVTQLGAKLERILDDVNYLFPRNQALGAKNKYRDWRMRALLDMHVRRPLLALYRPFALGVADCPAHITSVYLKSSMAMLTYMEELDPDTPGFDDVSHMYHVILKHDIAQAAFSVCYYIKRAGEAPAPSPASSGGGWSPEAGEPGGAGAASVVPGENRLIWSRAGMTKAVEKSLDNLVGLIKDACTDLKDVMALATVLASVQVAATPEQRLERIRAGLTKVLDGCLETLKAASLSSLPRASSATDPGSMTDWYNISKQPLIPNEIATNGYPDEYPLWDAEFWDPAYNLLDLSWQSGSHRGSVDSQSKY